MRLELKGSGIDVILIEPGPIATNISSRALAAFDANIDQAASPIATSMRAAQAPDPSRPQPLHAAALGCSRSSFRRSTATAPGRATM